MCARADAAKGLKVAAEALRAACQCRIEDTGRDLNTLYPPARQLPADMAALLGQLDTVKGGRN